MKRNKNEVKIEIPLGVRSIFQGVKDLNEEFERKKNVYINFLSNITKNELDYIKYRIKPIHSDILDTVLNDSDKITPKDLLDLAAALNVYNKDLIDLAAALNINSNKGSDE